MFSSLERIPARRSNHKTGIRNENVDAEMSSFWGHSRPASCGGNMRQTCSTSIKTIAGSCVNRFVLFCFVFNMSLYVV